MNFCELMKMPGYKYESNIPYNSLVLVMSPEQVAKSLTEYDIEYTKKLGKNKNRIIQKASGIF